MSHSRGNSALWTGSLRLPRGDLGSRKQRDSRDQDIRCSFLYSLYQALRFAYERHLINVARVEMTWGPHPAGTHFQYHCPIGNARKNGGKGGASTRLLRCSRPWARCFTCVTWETHEVKFRHRRASRPESGCGTAAASTPARLTSLSYCTSVSKGPQKDPHLSSPPSTHASNCHPFNKLTRFQLPAARRGHRTPCSNTCSSCPPARPPRGLETLSHCRLRRRPLRDRTLPIPNP